MEGRSERIKEVSAHLDLSRWDTRSTDSVTARAKNTSQIIHMQKESEDKAWDEAEI